MIISSFIVFTVNDHKVLSVDFTGGSQLVFNYKNYVSQGEIIKLLTKEGYDTSVSYKSSPIEGNQLNIVISNQSREKSSDGELAGIAGILNNNFPNAHFRGIQEQLSED